jgi:hypothetical protein
MSTYGDISPWRPGYFGPYSYDQFEPLHLDAKKYTAKEIMDVFKNHPGEIFPFKVEGPRTFTDGSVFRLIDATGLNFPDDTGNVAVTTTDTSVKFTVVGDGYFDAPGSTIEFSVIERDGLWVLSQDADAISANPLIMAGAGAFGLSQATWNQQSENLRLKVLELLGDRAQ